MKNLLKSIREYLHIRRQLGFKLDTAEYVLNSFANYVQRKKASHITSKLAVEFATKNRNSSPARWYARLGIIRRFALYFRFLDPLTEVPASDLLKRSYLRRSPYIYSSRDIVKLMNVCKNLPTRNPLQAKTYYTLFGLIAVTGMRTGEALALEHESVDLKTGIITIRESKFQKSRKIPIHTSTVKRLVSYARACECDNKNKSPYFFVNNSGLGLERSTVCKVFKKASIKAGLRMEGEPGGPRILDFRHTFAVRTLIRCYKEGLDVDEIIPILSTYLGHENPMNTYWYLTARPELLNLVNERLQKKLRGN